MGEIIKRDGVEIDTDVARHIKNEILRAEQLNVRTKELKDSDLVKEHMKKLEGEVNADTGNKND